MAVPQNKIVRSVTQEYLNDIDPKNPPTASTIEEELLNKVNAECTLENTGRAQGNKITLLKTLENSQIADILLKLHHVVAVTLSNSTKKDDKDLIAIWNAERGVYETGTAGIRSVARRYNREVTINAAKEIAAALSDMAPRVVEGFDQDWVPVANGDFNYRTQTLHEPSPDRIVLNDRGTLPYDKDVINVHITNPDDGTDWDMESWMLELADGNSGLCELLWKVLAASVRSNHAWEKVVLLYEKSGNNGKSTFTELATSLVGEARTLTASITELGDKDTLAELPGKCLIVSDDNDGKAFVKETGKFKSLATGGRISLSPKYERTYYYVFRGLQIHPTNTWIRFADKSNGLYRRLLYVPLVAKFEGRARGYIKNDYLKRPEVLRYALKRVLDMQFVKLEGTPETEALLGDAKIHNDPVRLFWEEHKNEFVWDLLPLEFLYAAFKAWSKETKPSGTMVDYTSFCESAREAVAESDDDWQDLGQGKKMKAASRMAAHEPLLQDYDLHQKWRVVFDRNKLFSNVLHRDPAAVIVATLAQVERLHAEDVARWEGMAVSLDLVSDTAHVHDHAMIRRSGGSCECPLGKPVIYPDHQIEHSRLLDKALVEAREVTV